MQESLEASHNLPGDAQHLRVSILVRALVRGWRHTGRLRVGENIIEARSIQSRKPAEEAPASRPKPPRSHATDSVSVAG